VLFCLPRGWIGGFSNSHTLCVSNHLSVLTLGQFAQVQPCAIKRIHPNNKERIARCAFLFAERGGFGCFFKTATRFACRTTFSVLTLRFFMFLLFVAAGLIRK